MPLAAYFAEKMTVLAALGPVEQAMVDPVTAARFAQAFTDDDLGPPPPEGRVDEQLVRTSVGTVPVRIYRPTRTGGGPPALIWLHGGGFAGGGIDMAESDRVGRELAFIHDVPVVTVDYSLSNGSTVTYPIPHRQVAEVFEWATAHRSDLGFADNRLAVGGASAGANLALAAVLELRHRHRTPPHALVLAYPLLYRTLVASPELEPDLAAALGTIRMTQHVVDHMFALYAPSGDSPFASAEGHDLRGLPPTLTVVSEYDDLRPSGEMFHRELLAASVDAQLYLAAGMPHGHLDRTRLVPEVGQTVQRIVAFLVRSSADRVNHAPDGPAEASALVEGKLT